MCMFCAAVPVAGAIGAKLNADQKRTNAESPHKSEKPIASITAGIIVLLLAGSMIYHTTFFGR
ncbi:MAG TPA: hypothetical protein VGK00_00915 [Anaerolineales bacterium]